MSWKFTGRPPGKATFPAPSIILKRTKQKPGRFGRVTSALTSTTLPGRVGDRQVRDRLAGVAPLRVEAVQRVTDPGPRTGVLEAPHLLDGRAPACVVAVRDGDVRD